MADSFSDYLVFVDESGDHGLDAIDPNYPVFVLAFCIFKKRDYIAQLVPAIQHFKFRHFGHDQVILHEVDIRKDRGNFTFLKTRERKNAFIQGLSAIVEQMPFTLITTVIRKEPYKQRYHFPDNPYHVALGFGLERIFYFLRALGGDKARTHIIVEKRGPKEDAELESEFRRVCDGANYEGASLPFDVIFADKKSNCARINQTEHTRSSRRSSTGMVPGE